MSEVKGSTAGVSDSEGIELVMVILRSLLTKLGEDSSLDWSFEIPDVGAASGDSESV